MPLSPPRCWTPASYSEPVRQLLDRRFNGYRGILLPHELDDVVTAVVVGYQESSASARQEVLDRVPPGAAGVLSVFGERMAAMAVRTDSVVPLYRGIVGMGMAQRALEDPRDNLYALAAVRHASVRVRTTISRLVEDLREYLPEPAAELFSSFDGRAERDKSLAAMGLAACGSGDGFRYVSGTTSAWDREAGRCLCHRPDGTP
jgi:hypothetical protein